MKKKSEEKTFSVQVTYLPVCTELICKGKNIKEVLKKVQDILIQDIEPITENDIWEIDPNTYSAVE